MNETERKLKSICFSGKCKCVKVCLVFTKMRFDSIHLYVDRSAVVLIKAGRSNCIVIDCLD